MEIRGGAETKDVSLGVHLNVVFKAAQREQGSRLGQRVDQERTAGEVNRKPGRGKEAEGRKELRE